jgi:hypothetical protein
VSKEKKEKEKKGVLSVGKLIFLVIFSLLLFFCPSKMILKLDATLP